MSALSQDIAVALQTFSINRQFTSSLKLKNGKEKKNTTIYMQPFRFIRISYLLLYFLIYPTIMQHSSRQCNRCHEGKHHKYSTTSPTMEQDLKRKYSARLKSIEDNPHIFQTIRASQTNLIAINTRKLMT